VRDAEAAGADAVLLAPMSYTPLNEEEVFAHFAAVAEATRLPLCIYNNPGTTHFTFSPALVARLSQIDSVLAVKNPAGPDGAGAELKALREQVPPAFSLGYAGDWNATEALISGGDAWYSVLAGLFPDACLPIVRAVQQGQMSEARRLNARLQPVWDLFAAFTSLRTVYAAANILELCTTKPPRPILPLYDDAVRQVRRVLENLELA
jgi:4-hydroxy-tetrahydrodipicolinate synthase